MTESNSNLPKVGKLVPVDIRKVWDHEALSFTPWVLENSDRLSEALGLDLELEAAEHPVGNFSLDLIGRDLESGQRVIIENQLEVTDHTHLGQIMTYAGGTDPKVIVWIAKSFREEHAAALQWLNENTDEEINFYGVEVSAVQIDDSRPAALFNLVVRPNSWEKKVRSSVGITTDASVSAERYVRFWHRFNERVTELHPDWKSLMKRADNRGSWTTLPTGVNGVWYGVNFAGAWGERDSFRNVKALRSEIYFGTADPEVNEARFQAFQMHKAELEENLGYSLGFEELPQRKSCRVASYKAGTIVEEDQWDEYIDYFISSQEKLRGAIEALGGLTSIFEAIK